MKISPRYGNDPAVRLDVAPEVVRAPLLRQRRRLAGMLGELSAEEWAAPSRCDSWTVQDVVAHLVTTDQFWAYSVACGLAGDPSQVLANFDPRASPASLVDSARGTPHERTLEDFASAAGALCTAIEQLDDAGWQVLAESPVGHVSMHAIVHHALWDGWIHEQDIREPLGRSLDHEPDEVEAALRYVLALSPAFALQHGTTPEGAVAVVTTNPELAITARVQTGHVLVAAVDPPADALVLRGDAVELLEALSVRRPLAQPVPAEQRWLVDGLAAVFEPEPSP